MSRVAFVDQDSYYRDLKDLSFDQRREVNFDHPDAFDTALMVQHIKSLKTGKSVEKPTYDFVQSTRAVKTVPVNPADIILVEGILVLHLDAVRAELDVRIFVETEDDIRIIRRLTRDIRERGRDFDHVVHQYLQQVRPMHMAFIEPSKHHADIIVPHGGNNEIAIDMLVGALRARLARAQGRAMTGEIPIVK